MAIIERVCSSVQSGSYFVTEISVGKIARPSDALVQLTLKCYNPFCCLRNGKSLQLPNSEECEQIPEWN